MHGANIYVCGRRESVLKETAQIIKEKTGSETGILTCDLRDPEMIEAMMDKIWADGPLDGLVNNAAANFIAPTKDISPRGYKAIQSTVMDGSFYCTLECGKRWIKEGIKGTVLSNLVTWVWTGSAYVVPASMAKSAINNMTQSLAVEWGGYGIRLNAIAPGPFPTEGAWEKLNPIEGASVGATQSDQIPMRRYGKMEELQNLVVFLMSDACEFLTGQTIAIDGGHHLAAPSTFADLAKLSEQEWAEAKEKIKSASERDKKMRSV